MNPAALYLALAILPPLIGGGVGYALSRKMAGYSALAGMVIGAVFAGLLMTTDGNLFIRWEWLPGMELGWHIDNLAKALIGLVYLISLLVHVFSLHYLEHETGLGRYFFKLGFFTTSMLALLAADHLILFFVFWELVGFSSFLLIGFWYKDAEKAKAAKEAFMVNRVADAVLLMAIILMVTVFDLQYLSELSVGDQSGLYLLAGFGLLVGAMGKSAQFPFFGWLTRAMAGPTPVSALIHAATMVAAGVYLLVRVAAWLPAPVLHTTAVIGSFTALLAAVAALTQHDIKKVLAYSTISQLGYMVMAVGVGAHQVAVFHLWTHAFFKAGLFLAAGSVIHYMHEVNPKDMQDMRQMGGLAKALPVTFVVFLVCGLALAGIPFFSGFLSKEGILAASWQWAEGWGSPLAFAIPDLAFITALLTPIYIGRQMLLVFLGTPRMGKEWSRGSEPLFQVKVPLLVLAIGSLWIAHSFHPFSAEGWWLGNLLFEGGMRLQASDAIVSWTLGLSLLLAGGGVAAAYWFFQPNSQRAMDYAKAEAPKGLFGFSHTGWGLDGFYTGIAFGYQKITRMADVLDRRVIEPLVRGVGLWTVVWSKLLAIVDREVVDGLVHLAAGISRLFSDLFRRMHSPNIQSQIGWMMLLLIVIFLMVLF